MRLAPLRREFGYSQVCLGRALVVEKGRTAEHQAVANRIREPEVIRPTTLYKYGPVSPPLQNYLDPTASSHTF